MSEAEELAKAIYELEMTRSLFKDKEQAYRKALQEYAKKVENEKMQGENV